MKHSFSVGQRVQLNYQGRARMPRARAYVGEVVKVWEHSETVRVLFDGRVTPLAVHFRYLERPLKIERKAASKSDDRTMIVLGGD